MKALNFEEVKLEISKVNQPKQLISILLWHPQSEMNVAHVFRLSDAANIKHIYLINPSPQIKWQRIEKLSRKSTRHIPHSIHDSISELNKEMDWIALEWTDESKEVYSCKQTNEFLLIVGNEQRGIPDEILDRCDQSIHLPMYGQNSSMNVAMATGIAVYSLIHCTA